MKKHLIPDRSTLPRLPYRLLAEDWWLGEDFRREGPDPSVGRGEEIHLHWHERGIQPCN